MTHLKDLKRDHFLCVSCLVAITGIFCHGSIYYDTRQIESLIRLIFSFLYLAGVFFLPRKFFYFAFAILAYVTTYWNRWHNFTSFFIINEVARKNPKYKIAMLVGYGLEVVGCLLLSDLKAEQAIIHIGTCAMIYTYFNKEDHPQQKTLNLTRKEKLILDEWLKVQDLKAITCCSRNTIYEHLKEARERNKINKNEELLTKYQDEIGIK